MNQQRTSSSGPRKSISARKSVRKSTVLSRDLLLQKRQTLLENSQSLFSEGEYKDLDYTTATIQNKNEKRLKVSNKGLITLNEDTQDVIDKRLEDNDRALKAAYENGIEFITNIKAANDIRIAKRYDEEVEIAEKVKELMDNKDKECEAQFDAIIERFHEMREVSDDPIKLPEKLAIAKRKIFEFSANKDAQIQKLREECCRLDDSYEIYLLNQKNDSHYLYIRMQSHLESMRTSYKECLRLLQQTIESERETINLTATRKWSQLHDKLDANLEMKHTMEREKRAFYDAQLVRIRLEHAEATRATRIRLERDEQSVFADLQELRATCLINSEKFDYNYQILQKKGDENVTVRNQQKRRLTQMREVVTQLRKEIRDIHDNFKHASAKCTREVLQFHTSFMELEKRADLYARLNDKKFAYVWKMNEVEAKALLDKVLAVDKILFEQQLGIDWIPPALRPLKKEELRSYKNAMSELHSHNFESDELDQDDESGTGSANSASTILRRASGRVKLAPNKSDYPEQMLADTRVLRIILRQIAEETGFVVESKLMNLLEPYISDDNKTIIEVDSIFNALGIMNMKDISTLINFFVPYAWCTVCLRPYRDSKPKEAKKVHIASPAERAASQMAAPMFRKSAAHSPKVAPGAGDGFMDADLQLYIQDIEKSNVVNMMKRQSLFMKPPSISTVSMNEIEPCEKHKFAIDTGCVLSAFREYTQANLNANAKTVIGGVGASEAQTPMAARLSCVRTTVSRMLSQEDMLMFWQRYKDVLSENRCKLWDTLEEGMKKYLQVLQRRDCLDTECEYLRQQNTELNHMLRPYLG